jgi:hypothetical protein
MVRLLSSDRLGASTRTIINHCIRPNFVGSGSIANGWTTYTQNSPVGSRSVSGNKQTITVTSSPGPFRFGQYIGGIPLPISPKIKLGDTVYFSCTVDTSLLQPGTNVGMYVELSDGTSTVFPETSGGVPGVTLISRAVVATFDIDRISPYVWISSVSALATPSIAVFSNALITSLAPGESSLPYFDGNSVDTSSVKYEWRGEPNASSSIQYLFDTSLQRSALAVDRQQIIVPRLASV